MRSLTRISRDVGQSVAQLGKECDALCVDGTEGLQSRWLKNVEAWKRRVFCRFSGRSIIIIIIIIIMKSVSGSLLNESLIWFIECLLSTSLSTVDVTETYEIYLL